MTFLAADEGTSDWAARTGWVVGLLLIVVLLYWLMREGWKWRGLLQSDLPGLADAPEQPGEPVLVMAGRYHGSTKAGQWLERIVAHGLGARSRADVTLTDAGLDVRRPGARDFFVPTDALRGARLDKGIAGKVLTEGGLLVITWQLGEQLIDSGFRSHHAAEHTAWVAAINDLTGGPSDAVATQRDGAATPEAVALRGATPATPEAVTSRGATPETPEAVTLRGATPATPEKGT
ncbi:hypothetical protein FHS42_002652 [Streptomyces zagrosensis]|uniref:PH domain-containing protein n=1 Tax=Streptomyces zagrosensis TaxID=1042984 RepID=A0A7W9Q8K4_9ACTN|nr:hypothetical protein [Streptomyces zagrosensis]